MKECFGIEYEEKTTAMMHIDSQFISLDAIIVQQGSTSDLIEGIKDIEPSIKDPLPATVTQHITKAFGAVLALAKIRPY